jgi:hypothetical protein
MAATIDKAHLDVIRHVYAANMAIAAENGFRLAYRPMRFVVLCRDTGRHLALAGGFGACGVGCLWRHESWVRQMLGFDTCPDISTFDATDGPQSPSDLLSTLLEGYCLRQDVDGAVDLIRRAICGGSQDDPEIATGAPDDPREVIGQIIGGLMAVCGGIA